MKKTQTEICAEIMTSFINDGLKESISSKDIKDAGDHVQALVEALTFIQGRLIATYLVRMLQEGDDKDMVAHSADMIVTVAQDLLDRSVSQELSFLVEKAADLMEAMSTSKSQTSH